MSISSPAPNRSAPHRRLPVVRTVLAVDRDARTMTFAGDVTVGIRPERMTVFVFALHGFFVGIAAVLFGALHLGNLAYRSNVALVFGLSGLTYLVLGAVGGALSDRFGPRLTTSAGMLILVAGLVGCYRGLTVQGGPKGVGIAVNETVVYAFICLFVINVIMTAIGVRVLAR